MADLGVVLDHVVIHVTDWEVANRFYGEVMGAEVVSRGEGWVYRWGNVQFNVHGPGVEAQPVARIPVPPGGSDCCFVWPGSVRSAIGHLERHGVEIELGPVPRHGRYGEGESLYFRDPFGSLMEFLCYPDSAGEGE